MKTKSNIFIVLFLFFTLGVNAQIVNEVNTPSKLYSDRVTNQDGTPLNGINIRVKGTSISTTTDINGEFTINAENGDIIVLSKNGKIINTYQLNGSIYYEVEDKSNQIQESKKLRSISKKSRLNNSVQFQKELDSAILNIDKNPTQSVDFIGNALKYANNKTQISQSYVVLGDVYMNLKQYDLAVSNFKVAIDNSKSTTNQLKLARAYLLSKEYQNSESQYYILLKKSSITTTQKVEVYEGLGDIYSKLNQYKKALNQYQTGLTLAKRISNDSKIISLNSKISNVLEAQGKMDKAEDYLLSSQISAVKQSPQKAIIESKRAADFYSRNKVVDKEVQLRKETLKNLVDSDLELVVVEDDVLTKPKAKLDLGNAYLKQKNFKEAIQLLEESAAEAEITFDIETQKDAIQKLSEAYVYLGDDNKALSNYKKYVALVDVLYKQKENEINEAVSLNKDLSVKQNRITSLEKDRELSESKLQLYQTEKQLTVENYRRQKNIIYFLVFGVLLLLLSLFWMFRSNKQRKLANNLLALKSLRTQMNPHFIFNALNSV
ncbi:MAG: tetratricopeptide repeat protein, partial [Flavobacteriaceae bacterium]|nr:tetratricopeptide repeat protein [Flavobacteriaceae bacterium]